MAIILVGQGYKSTEGHHNFKTGTGTTYRGWEQPMDIGKSNENFKDRKPKCFNYSKYRHMAKEYWSKKKERETRTYFKCNKEEHIARDYKEKQTMKKQQIQEELDDEDKKKE